MAMHGQQVLHNRTQKRIGSEVPLRDRVKMRRSIRSKQTQNAVIKKGNAMKNDHNEQAARSSATNPGAAYATPANLNSFGIGFPNPPAATPTEPVRIAIVDDNDSIRTGYAGIVRLSSDLALCGLYPDAESTLRDIDAVAPHVVLLDLSLPGMSGLDCLREIKQRLPKTQVIILTLDCNPDGIIAAIQAGASGYLTKATPPEQILHAIREVRTGGAPMSSCIARALVERVRLNGRAQPAQLEDKSLTARENEVLRSVSEGYRAKEIAERLHISTFTVQAHIRNIYEKLGVRSLSQAIAKLSHFGQQVTH
jgi:DNA-binding NarL/FixJ family response regulator